MDEFGDASSKLSAIINDLGAQVQDSSARVNSLKKLTEKLAPELAEKSHAESIDSKDSKSISKASRTGKSSGRSLIKSLEDERLKLVMDIQKQEFLKTKLSELINHNSEVMLSVKEYLQNKPTMIKDDYKLINEQVDHYWRLSEPKIEALSMNNAQMAKSFREMEVLVAEIDMGDVDEGRVKEVLEKVEQLFRVV